MSYQKQLTNGLINDRAAFPPPSTKTRKSNKCTRVSDPVFREDRVSWRQAGDLGRSGTRQNLMQSYLLSLAIAFSGVVCFAQSCPLRFLALRPQTSHGIVYVDRHEN